MIHSCNDMLDLGDRKIPVTFYVINGKSNQGLVLGYTCLATNDATINFKYRELMLGGMSVHCMSSHVEDSNVPQ